MNATIPQAVCGFCRFFTGGADALERAIPGLNILSSAHGSVRAETGLCERHDSFVTPAGRCPEFSRRLTTETRARTG